MKVILALFALLAIALAEGDYQNYHQHHTSPIPILKSDSQQGKDGSYQFGYETGHGIHAEEHGFVKNAGHKDGEIQVAHGSYSYTGPDGHPVSVHYIADENGFQVQGDHLPTPPPVPKEIAESLAKQAANPHQYQEEAHQQYEYQPHHAQQHYSKY